MPDPTHAIIIDSIGTAVPAAVKPLADKLEMPFEFILKLIYNAPTVFAKNLEEDAAQKVVAILKHIGLEARATNDPNQLNIGVPTPLDICVYVHDVAKLNNTVQVLSDFLGAPKEETFNLLNRYPAVVLGGVSQATATALETRIDAEVVTANPKATPYMLEVLTDDKMLHHQLTRYLGNYNITPETTDPLVVRDLTYVQSQEVWKQFQSTQAIRLSNQAFERFTVTLEGIDAQNPQHRTILIQQVGMPEEILDEVLESLPIQLHDSVSTQKIDAMLDSYQQAGLQCSKARIDNGPRKLVVEEWEDKEKVRAVLERFVPAEELPRNLQAPWQSPVPLTDLMSRYAVWALEAAGAEAEATDY